MHLKVKLNDQEEVCVRAGIYVSEREMCVLDRGWVFSGTHFFITHVERTSDGRSVM